MSAAVRKAVIPMAGNGTRFRPITHVVPKDFLPLVNKPLFHYMLDELVAAGCDEVVCVVHPARDFVTPYIKAVPFPLNITLAYQEQAAGLGHAVGCAAQQIGDDYFFVLLPDVIIDAEPNVSAQLQSAHERCGRGVIALRPEPEEKLSRYGVADVSARDGALVTLRTLVEKPPTGTAPSNLTIVGRYLLPPQTMQYIAETKPGALGEIQLTDALRRIAQHDGLFGWIETERAMFDSGTPPGWLAANAYFANKLGVK